MLSPKYVILIFFASIALSTTEKVVSINGNETIITNDNFAVRWHTILPSFSLHPIYRDRPIWKSWVAFNGSKIREIDSNGVTVQETIFADQPWSRTVKDGVYFGSNATLMAVESEMQNGAQFGMFVYSFATNAMIQYGNFTFSIGQQALKYSLNVTDWPYVNLANKLVIDIEYSTDTIFVTRKVIYETPQYKDSTITTETLNMTMRLFAFAIADGVEVPIDIFYKLKNTDWKSIIYSYAFNASNTIYYDPDFSVLLSNNPDCSSSNWCNDHGACFADNSCDCDYGYKGAACETAYCPNDCSTHGDCITNDPNRGPYCSCDDGWTNVDCATPNCPGEPYDCSGRGSCSAVVDPPMCVCNDGWTGFDCSVPNCAEEQDLCGDHGACNDHVDPPRCMCDTGYYGEVCEKVAPNCSSSASFCKNGGKCGSGGVCQCATGWASSDCSIEICPGYDTVGNCNFLGTCDTTNATTGENPPKCICDEKRTGVDCSIAVCEDNCSGNGNCYGESVTPVCICDDGFIGSNCAQRAQNDVESKPKSRNNGYKIAVGVVFGVAGIVGASVALGTFLYKRKKRQRFAIRMMGSDMSSVVAPSTISN